jgi:hypothetical protein
MSALNGLSAVYGYRLFFFSGDLEFDCLVYRVSLRWRPRRERVIIGCVHGSAVPSPSWSKDSLGKEMIRERR